MTDFWCDAKLVWLCECAWLEMDVVALGLAAQRSWGGVGKGGGGGGGRVADATQTPIP